MVYMMLISSTKPTIVKGWVCTGVGRDTATGRLDTFILRGMFVEGLGFDYYYLSSL